jgi:hypothetical protein
VRRMLRMETFASSALWWAILMYSVRRSSVSAGHDATDDVAVVARVDAEVGVADRLLDRVHRALVEGLMMIVRASGVWKDASCCSGVGAP